MAQNYQRIQQITGRRQSAALPVFMREEHDRRLSLCINAQHRLSTVSQIFSPHGTEYHPQLLVPPNGPDAPQQLFLTEATEQDNETMLRRRISIISSRYPPLEETINEEDITESNQEPASQQRRTFLFFAQPIVSGLLVLPILILFWQCGWNLTLIVLNHLNGSASTLHLQEYDSEEYTDYPSRLLLILYAIAQICLLMCYLAQDFLFNFLNSRHWLLRNVLLKLHILGLASIYIIQWVMLWTFWDQYTPHEWYFELTLSFSSIFALIVFTGHISDLICAPFLMSYDSIEYCLQFGCPLLTRQMDQWKINLLNYILYEIVISNIAIIAWRGFYHILDKYLYPHNFAMSAGLCLIIGYVLYFPLMYFQTYFEELNVRYEFWTFVAINFPQFYRNIRHLSAFASCLFVWRGFWLLYDTYIYIFEEDYQTYLMLFLISFFILAFLQTSSSTNGPLNNITDEYNFFPLYPNCYLSIVLERYPQLDWFRSPIIERNR
ncbi:unnamed protein product [Rotaria sp. Silwood1]|nr:unnamed protein product [Rotaria sp. Silwood1]CAF1513397.1 unnamed protein product [Rotaria sp. Silwood1]CAF3600355.1 unnamed protein product [Rotaria sp. Silwood1]CAF3627566.1 unnamed protein product [Rotaria sp. Silwood1]CAF4636821.1 unnamed protein product [Rotaria sp. Silwood1]